MRSTDFRTWWAAHNVRFHAEPGSRSDEALNLLASWTATPAAPRS
jgi:hypothetical protein